MRFHRRPWALIIAVFVAGLLGTPVESASAQSAASVSQRVEQAHRAFAAQDFSLAATEFLAAYAAYPITELLCNAAASYEEHGRASLAAPLAAAAYEQAASHYQACAAAPAVPIRSSAFMLLPRGETGFRHRPPSQTGD